MNDWGFMEVVEVKGGGKCEWNPCKQWGNDFWNEENAYHFCLQKSIKINIYCSHNTNC